MWEPPLSHPDLEVSPVPKFGDKPRALHCPLECSLCPPPFVGLYVPLPHPTTLSLGISKHLPLPLAGLCPGQSCSHSVDGRGTTPSSPPWPLVPSTACAFLCQGFSPRLEPVNNPVSPPAQLCTLPPLFVSERAV